MKKEQHIGINQLCSHYELEMSFFIELRDMGLIEINSIEQSYFIHQNELTKVEKMVRMHRDLGLNLEGIDTVLNLLDKIDSLQQELIDAKNRLRFYED